ncbi:type II secretion system protein [Candidatus Roizmanbacteria bacterium]|nr:type II secretion system protein [Candidatus Roizmanbacteria bacterium]
MHKDKNKSAAFTLFEIIVVVAIVGLTLPVVFSLFFAFLRQQVKVYRLTEVKRQGDFAVRVIENTIKTHANTITKDASGVVVCKIPESDTVYGFKDRFNNEFRFFISGGSRISSAVTNLPPAPTLPIGGGDLTNDKVTISGFTLTCSRSTQFSPPVINMSFQVDYNPTDPGRPEEQATLRYQSTIKLRNL